MSYTVDENQHCESTKTSNKKVAQKILDSRKAEIIEGRFCLRASTAPCLEAFGRDFLDSIPHPSTKKRYRSSITNLVAHFGDVPVSRITIEGIEGFKATRLAAKVRAATVNRDLAVARRILKFGAKRRFVAANLFREIEMLEERKERRLPHILTFDEEKLLLASAPNHIHVLVTLILETGLRSRREALALRWKDIDFASGVIQILQSKSLAGRRIVPMSSHCKKELLAWRTCLGPGFSEFVFASPIRPGSHLIDVRVAWSKAVKAAGLAYFWIYDLRHTFASRITEAGASPIFVAQIMGHSSPNILQTYVKAIDEFRRSAILKLETLREVKTAGSPQYAGQNSSTIQ